MIQIDLQPEIEKQLLSQAEARGVTFSDYLRYLLTKEAEQPSARDARGSVAEAIANIRELRRGSRLDGLKLKDLIHEGHKY